MHQRLPGVDQDFAAERRHQHTSADTRQPYQAADGETNSHDSKWNPATGSSACVVHRLPRSAGNRPPRKKKTQMRMLLWVAIIGNMVDSQAASMIYIVLISHLQELLR